MKRKDNGNLDENYYYGRDILPTIADFRSNVRTEERKQIENFVGTLNEINIFSENLKRDNEVIINNYRTEISAKQQERRNEFWTECAKESGLSGHPKNLNVMAFVNDYCDFYSELEKCYDMFCDAAKLIEK